MSREYRQNFSSLLAVTSTCVHTVQTVQSVQCVQWLQYSVQYSVKYSVQCTVYSPWFKAVRLINAPNYLALSCAAPANLLHLLICCSHLCAAPLSPDLSCSAPPPSRYREKFLPKTPLKRLKKLTHPPSSRNFEEQIPMCLRFCDYKNREPGPEWWPRRP